MSGPAGIPVYRDGQRAGLVRWRERRTEVEARAAALSGEDWTILPPALQRDLERLQALLRQPDAQLDAIEAAEADLEAYAERIEVAHSLAAQFRAERARTASARRRRAILIAVGAGLFAVAGWIAIRRAESQRAVDAARCRADPWCRMRGACHAEEREIWPGRFACIAASDAECAASVGCAEHGRCVAQGGVCVLLDGYCRAHWECGAEGLCRPDQSGEVCVAEQPEDCRQSAACLERGACTPWGWHCHVGSDEDCKASAACRERGACQASAGVCVDGPTAVCRASMACSVWGTCSHRDGRCLALLDGDCIHSAACGHNGLCTARDGRCVAATDLDCQRADVCRHGGTCIAVGGRCEARP